MVIAVTICEFLVQFPLSTWQHRVHYPNVHGNQYHCHDSYCNCRHYCHDDIFNNHQYYSFIIIILINIVCITLSLSLQHYAMFTVMFFLMHMI